MTFTRRRFIQATGAGAAALGMPTIARSQTGAIRVGLMTVKTGPLASGGIDMERALVQYLKERDTTLAGRKVDLFVGDSGGVPAQARTKIQELVERDKIQVMIGPLDAASALAADDYIRQQQLPTLSVAAAEDLTQRKANPWFERVFEDAGGKIVQKMFPPLTVPDYATFLAQLKTNIDGIFLGFAGSNGFRWYKQFNEYGLKGKIAVVGGMTAFDEAVLRNMGDEALGIITACWYSAELDNPINKKFAT